MRLVGSVLAVSATIIIFPRTLKAAPPRPNGIGKPGHRSCYFASWALYRQEDIMYSLNDVPGDLCTHLVYEGYSLISKRTWGIKPLEPWYEVTSNAYEKFLTLQKKHPHLKSLFSVGGWDQRSLLPQMLSAKVHRDAFINSTVEFLKEYGLDGLDIDWEFPAEGGPEGTSQAHINNFLTLIRELRAAFDTAGKDWELTAAVTISQDIVNGGRHLNQICDLVDSVTSVANGVRGYWDGFARGETNVPGITCQNF
ncbi:endochitinase-like [Macrobrachium rosenbergii]|uniref:endochitinase-like n=1 Tax=Macrobrachium rosenbergii TaxID=79674 RepID=UPI0034D58987